MMGKRGAAAFILMIIIVIGIAVVTTRAYAQLSGVTGALRQQIQEQSRLNEYNSTEYGIAFSYPRDYLFDDYDYFQETRSITAGLLGYGVIGTLCPTSMTLPSLTGGQTCNETQIRTPILQETKETPRVMNF